MYVDKKKTRLRVLISGISPFRPDRVYDTTIAVTDQILCSEAEIQRGPQALRRERRDRTIRSWTFRIIGQSQGIAKKLSLWPAALSMGVQSFEKTFEHKTPCPKSFD